MSLIIAILAVLFLLLMLEFLFRILRLGPKLMGMQFMAPDAEIGFRGRPGSSQVAPTWTGEFAILSEHNALGFRDRDHAEAKSPGGFRIMCLGDSYTYGGGAEAGESYPARLEARLNSRPGAAVEVMNLGLPGYFIRQMRQCLGQMAPRFQPDLVLAAVLPLHVVDAAMGMNTFTLGSEGYLLWNEVPTIGRVGNFLHARSRLLQVALEKPLKRRRKKIFRRLHPRKREDLFQDHGSYESGWQALEGEVRSMKSIAAAAGARYGLVYIPELDFAQPHRDYPVGRLGVFCAAEGIPFISTFAAIAEAAARETLYFPRDGHLNPAGYDLVARVVAEELERMGLVPQG